MGRKATTAATPVTKKKTRNRKSGVDAVKFKVEKCWTDMAKVMARVEKWGGEQFETAKRAVVAVNELRESLALLPAGFTPPTAARRDLSGSGVRLKSTAAAAYEGILEPTKIYKVDSQRGKFLVLIGSDGGKGVFARNHFDLVREA